MSNRNNRVGMPAWLALVDWAAKVEELFGDRLWLCGSAANGERDYHDIDVRLQLDDDVFEHWFGRPRAPYWAQPRWRFLCAAISAWGQQETGLPIDFQAQRDCEVQVSERGQHRTRITWSSGDVSKKVWKRRAAELREQLDELMDAERVERESKSDALGDPGAAR